MNTIKTILFLLFALPIAAIAANNEKFTHIQLDISKHPDFYKYKEILNDYTSHSFNDVLVATMFMLNDQFSSFDDGAKIKGCYRHKTNPDFVLPEGVFEFLKARADNNFARLILDKYKQEKHFSVADLSLDECLYILMDESNNFGFDKSVIHRSMPEFGVVDVQAIKRTLLSRCRKIMMGTYLSTSTHFSKKAMEDNYKKICTAIDAPCLAGLEEAMADVNYMICQDFSDVRAKMKDKAIDFKIKALSGNDSAKQRLQIILGVQGYNAFCNQIHE